MFQYNRNLICGTHQVRLTSNGKESEEKTEQQCGELFDLKQLYDLKTFRCCNDRDSTILCFISRIPDVNIGSIIGQENR